MTDAVVERGIELLDESGRLPSALARGEAIGATTESVLEELQGTDVEDTPPVDLLGRVQEWQRRLAERVRERMSSVLETCSVGTYRRYGRGP